MELCSYRKSPRNLNRMIGWWLKKWENHRTKWRFPRCHTVAPLHHPSHGWRSYLALNQPWWLWSPMTLETSNWHVDVEKNIKGYTLGWQYFPFLWDILCWSQQLGKSTTDSTLRNFAVRISLPEMGEIYYCHQTTEDTWENDDSTLIMPPS